ncbi:MAG: hypothetical protein KKB50_01740 [Planctomycetes bacterium]|nr:hypothetical protein [Planctomycetota bacterium]
MADQKEETAATDPEAPATPEVSEKAQAKAHKWFEKANQCRERREYDYAIECFITGLSFWPEAVEEGHRPLRSLAIQRHQAGGKKPGMMEGIKRSMSTKDAKQSLLNAELLLAKDPTNNNYLDGVLKNANRAELNETIKWIAPLVMESLRKDKKPNSSRFKAFREVLENAAGRADNQGNPVLATEFYELALQSIDYLMIRSPGDHALRDLQRDMSGKLTIARGKYGDAGTFRESLQDGDKQKLLHDADRVQQGDQTLDAFIAAARREYEENPDVPAKINALVDTLTRRESRKEDDEAIALLMKAYQESRNYSFKLRADELRLRQLARQTGALEAKAKESGADEDRQQARLAAAEQAAVELEVHTERCANYPTDLRLKFRLGSVLFRSRRFDETIPVLQAAQADPKNRMSCALLIGRSFYEKEAFTQAREVLSEALDDYELTDDLSKALTYWLGRAYEAEGLKQEARATYGKLLRQDYDYAKGDARQRHESLK